MLNSEEFDREFDLNRTTFLEQIVKQVIEENAELLERLGSDYDDNGIPYWEKWHKNDN